MCKSFPLAGLFHSVKVTLKSTKDILTVKPVRIVPSNPNLTTF